MIRLMVLGIFFVLSSLANADARIDANECHVPFDNANTNNEFKFQNCAGLVIQYGAGASAHASYQVTRKDQPSHHYTIVGWDRDDVTKGEHKVITSGSESGAPCNIADAEGNTWQANWWNATTIIQRTKNYYLVDVTYSVHCDSGRAP